MLGSAYLQTPSQLPSGLRMHMGGVGEGDGGRGRVGSGAVCFLVVLASSDPRKE